MYGCLKTEREKRSGEGKEILGLGVERERAIRNMERGREKQSMTKLLYLLKW